MTNYPNSQDNIITLPSVTGSSQEDIAINALRDATLAIENELGITPSGIYTDVRARFDILEARINNPSSPTVLSDGYVNSPLFIVNSLASLTVSISDGYGFPTENRINGSLYLRNDGYVNQGLYSRRGGVWKEVSTDPWTAGGDLSGTYLSQTVIGLRGKVLSSSLAAIGAIQDGYHLTWDQTDGYWRAETGFLAGGDLSGTRTSQTVIRLQGKNLSAVAPVDGYALVWVAADNQWEPQVRPILFDGYSGRTNLRSNKFLQSPIDNTKTGIINFGSRSSGVTAGATNDYAAILSGDRHTVSGNFGLVIGGDSHTASNQYATVINGLTNTASGQYSCVLNGTTNIASGQYSDVLDGYSNTASATNSFVINGGNNQALANFSSVINGITNIINVAGTNSVILGGVTNTISSASNFIGTTSNSSIGATSSFSTILNGSTNIVSASSAFSFIGTGNNITVTGLYATVLNATTATANGLHSLILNGNTNSVTGSFSTIGNGNNNTISGGISYATILDGYSNTITGSGSFIGDGYSHTISGLYSTILNGNTNTINARNSTILNGSSNLVDSNSAECTILTGTGNNILNTTNGLITGNSNTLNTANNSYILGTSNSIQSSSSKVIGSLNIIAAGGSFNRVFGNSNNLGVNSVQNNIFGLGNTLINSTHDNNVIGFNNTIDGYGGSFIAGNTNIANSSMTVVAGQFGKSRMFGQEVRSNARFTPGKFGEVQWSRLILDGYQTAGGSFSLQLQDLAQALPSNAFFMDGYAYDMSIRVLIVNNQTSLTVSTMPVRYVFDVLAHQEGGVLVLDNVNQTLVSRSSDGTNPAGPTWTVTIGTSGNQLTILVDPEVPPYILPANSPSNRRAIATIEMREISRVS